MADAPSSPGSVGARGALRGVIALDGPSGTGKTTVSRQLAARLGTSHLDTGAMYRAVTLAVLRAEVPPDDADAVLKVARGVTVSVGTDPRRPSVALDGEDVGADIRSPEVTAAVSAVSSIPDVRELLVARQRRIVRELLGTVGGAVVEGRDIGTVVVPDAPLKVFLTASSHVRAARRNAQDTAAGRASSPDDTRAAVERRDRLDSTRAASPMRPADDALPMDTSELSIDQVLVALCELAVRRGMLAGCPAEARP